MNRHAYLIIAHNEFGILEKLIKLIDDERNDIYIHIDKKVKKFDFEYFNKIPEYSEIKFVNRYDIAWGSFSMVECELELLKNAVFSKTEYEYIHLISGVDMILKSQEYINNFFQKNKGKEFIHFTYKDINNKTRERISLYHLFRNKRNIFFRILTNIFLVIQRIFKINRIKNKNLEIQKGSQWFSITGEFAKYIVSKEEFIRKTFNYSYCADEVFIQTLIMNSEFKNNLFNKNFDNDHYACLRCIDWKRGNPWIFKKDDYDMLVNSKAIFARKFSEKVDKDIVDMIFINLKGEI